MVGVGARCADSTLSRQVELIPQLLRQVHIVPGPPPGVQLRVGVVGVPTEGLLVVKVGDAQGLQLRGELAGVAGVDAVVAGVGGDVGLGVGDARFEVLIGRIFLDEAAVGGIVGV